ncbi:MAG: DMT family transporter [Ilumatobacter sp.]|uniref:DMT family transporter n=1 Tax=Ilumatobacter sp. TaxID=1967498 RepID=UPI00262307AD|nr:DMT family transporter [Ilumatobacter sp.]MDJ0767501.1 DMT family transporter [Ilumatobacter sp.]
MTEPTRRDLELGLLGTGVAVVAWGSSGVIVKAIDLGALSIGFWRFLTYALILAVWMRWRSTPVTPATLRASFAGGVSLGVDVVLFFTAVKLTNVVNATTIGALQPLVVAVFAAKLFGERIRGRDIAAAAVAIVAVVVIVVESSGTPEWNGWGDLAAVGALFAWSGYFIFSKRSRGTLTSQEYTVGTAVWTGLICLGTGLVVGQDMSFPAADQWVPLLGLTLGAGLLGHTVMNWSLVRVPLWLGSTLTLLIPVVSSLAAWIFLDEPLTAVQIAAICVVIASLATIVATQPTPEPVRAPQAPAVAPEHP